MRRFQCGDTKIINFDRVCDGTRDCSNGSDETAAQCGSLICPAKYEKCPYGACVRNKSQCSDSDESSSEHVVGAGPGSCHVVSIPRRGHANYIDDSREPLQPNDAVENFAQIEYGCNEGNVLVGFPLNLCLEGSWVNAVPECQPRCNPTEISSITFVANCFDSGDKRVRCTEPLAPATIAKINCQRGYESLRPTQQILSCGKDGRWYPAPIPCTQICGEEGPEGSPYVVGGEIANITQVPWHVGIYRNINYQYEQVCGGTILNAKVVISAMHCFWDVQRSQPYAANEYRIAAGKFHRDYNDAADGGRGQMLAVDRIHYVDGYQDYVGLYANDIALLVLSHYIEFKVHIAPICIEYDLTFDEKTVPLGWVGRVAGWGLTESHGRPSPDLKMIELPVVSREQCVQAVGPAFAPFVTPDKFCAGHVSGVSVCQGDSGGGLAFSKMVNGRTIFYLRGIVSTGPNKGSSCDNDKYATFVNTAHFSDFIFRHEFENRPSGSMIGGNETTIEQPMYERCHLNRVPANGAVARLGDSQEVLAIGTGVESFGIVQYSCMQNFMLVGNGTSVCVNGTWSEGTPECQPKMWNSGDLVFPDDHATGRIFNIQTTSTDSDCKCILYLFPSQRPLVVWTKSRAKAGSSDNTIAKCPSVIMWKILAKSIFVV